ncbi:hypothetical protein KKF61_01810 [Patescibacteria group bacterium]|nr:hypothetical protein [Patescibacteria group bacterium]MBU0964567.1 hypothetical protein [Patescibacteria group bacterium]
MTKFLTKKFRNGSNGFINEKAIRKIELNTTRLKVLLVVIIIMAGFSYLYYMNQTATGGFDIKGLENNIEELSKQNKQFELRTAELQSLGSIEAASNELEMVATTTIDYLPAIGPAVAVR